MMCELDADLVRAARSGDKQAFGKLVERHLPNARRMATRLINNQEIVQDLAQEAMLQAYLSLDNLREVDRFQSWLHGIVRNVCNNYLRSRKADFFSWEALSGGISFPTTEDDPQDVVEKRELNHLIQEAVGALSPKNQTILRLFYFEQLSTTEIAGRLSISVAAIKDRLYQSRKKLREQLVPHYAPDFSTRSSPVAAEERRNAMVKINIMHSFAVEEADHYILYLMDTASQRVLPIWVGLYEGNQIAQSLQEGETARPMTYHLMANLLHALGARLQEVRIEELKDNTFYAVVKTQSGDTIHELDARPSDAIALALHMEAPVFVAGALMEKVAQKLPRPWNEKTGPEEMHRVVQQRGTKEWQRKIEESTQFTARGHQLWSHLKEEALRFNHHYIGTEHLLLSLVRDRESTAAKVLSALRVEPEQIVEAVERLVGYGPQAPLYEPVLVPRMIKVVELSLEEKERLDHPALGTGHLLLALAGEGQGMAITILRSLGVEPAQIRTKALELMSPT